MRRWKWFAGPHTEPRQKPGPPPQRLPRENRPAWNSPTVILNRLLMTRGQESRASRHNRRWDRG